MHPSLINRTYHSIPLPDHRWARRREETGDGLLRRMVRSTVRNWQRRRMIAAFEALDDRILRDIGILRGDIPRVVDEFDDREWA